MFRRRSSSDGPTDAAPRRRFRLNWLRLRRAKRRPPLRRRRPDPPPFALPPRRRRRWSLMTAGLCGASLGVVRGLWEWGFTGEDFHPSRAMANLFLWTIAVAVIAVIVAAARNRLLLRS